MTQREDEASRSSRSRSERPPPARVTASDPTSARRSLTESLTALALGAATGLVGALGIDRSLRLARGIGRSWVRLGGPRSERVRRQLAEAMPERTGQAREQLVSEVFEHLACGVVELLLLRGRHRASLVARVDVEGIENLHAAEAQTAEGGVLILTAHLGNWELACAKVAALDLPVAVVYRGLRNRVLDRALLEIRGDPSAARAARAGTPTAPAVEQIRMGRLAGLAVARALRAGSKVLVLLDQDARREEGVFVPFFGRPASTRVGPMLLADTRGVPVVPAFIHRMPDGRHRIHVRPALALEPGASRDEAVLRRNVERATRAIEDEIRRAPGQWIWTHRRWRTQPRPVPVQSND